MKTNAKTDHNKKKPFCLCGCPNKPFDMKYWFVCINAIKTVVAVNKSTENRMPNNNRTKKKNRFRTQAPPNSSIPSIISMCFCSVPSIFIPLVSGNYFGHLTSIYSDDLSCAFFATAQANDGGQRTKTTPNTINKPDFIFGSATLCFVCFACSPLSRSYNRSLRFKIYVFLNSMKKKIRY